MKINGVEMVYKGWLSIFLARMTDGAGQPMSREIEHHGHAAVVLPYDAARRTALMIEIPRAPVVYLGVADRLLEAPAGMIDPGEAPMACARREALEEAGVALDALEPVAEVFSMPGISTETLHLYLAPYAAADRIGAGGGIAEEQEDIEVVEIALADLWTRVERGEVRDMKTFALIQALRLRRPELF